MTGALFRKEIRGALPLAALWWTLWATPLIEHGLAGAPDLTPFGNGFDAWDEPGMSTLFGAIMSLWLSGSLVQTEHADGTIEFLDSLPTTRSRVFAAKFAAGLAILVSGPVLQVLIALGLDGLSRSSAADPLPAGVVVPWIVLTGAQMGILWCAASVLSFLRRFQWLAAGLVGVVWIVLARYVPGVRVFDVSALTDGGVHGTSLAVPWSLLAAQIPVAAVCVAAAWVLYCGLGDRLLAFGRRLGDTSGGRVIIAVTTVAAVLIWIIVPSILISQSRDHSGDDDAPHAVKYTKWGTGRITTARYTFTYPAASSDRASEVAARADAAHDRVASWLGCEPIGRIDVDATQAGPAMYAGRAFHEAMQVDVAGARDTDDAVATLAHETAHLFIDSLARRTLDSGFRWTRVIHEGLASYVEHRFFRTPAQLAEHRLAAVLADAWSPLTFELISDDEELAGRRDSWLVYPAGEMLMAALVEVHGDEAPQKFLRAWGRADRPHGLQGPERWRDAFQTAGLNLEAVVARWRAMLDEGKARHADLVASLPRLRGRLTEHGSRRERTVAVAPILTRECPPGWAVVVRFRRDADDGLDEFVYGEKGEDGAFTADRAHFPGQRIGFQLGLHSEATGVVVWESWDEATLGR